MATVARGSSMGHSRAASAILFALLAGMIIAAAPPAVHSQTASSSGFTVESAVWGLPSAPAEAAPGTQNVPLVITLQYYYYNTASGITATLDLPRGFTDTSGNSVTTAAVSGEVPSGAVVPLTFYLNIGSNTQLGTYAFPMVISWGAITQVSPLESVSVTQSTSVSVPLKGKVNIQFTTSAPTLSAGTVNSVPLVVTNTGTGNATNIDLAVSAASSLLSAATVSVLNTPPEISTLAANSSMSTNLSIYAPQSLAGSTFSLSITGTYSDAYGNAHAVAASVGLYVQSALSQPVTINAGPTQLVPGSVNNITISVANAGQRALPVVQLNVVVPPSVSLLKQFPVTISNLAAGATAQVVMPVFVSSSLSGTPVTIAATVTYTDTAGSTGTTTQNLGFYVPLALLAQNPSVGLSGFSFNPQLIFPGTVAASLQVVVYNSGTTPGTNVNVTLVPSSPVYALGKGSLSQVVGLLPVGQSAPLAFTIGILNSTTPLNTTLTLLVKPSGVAQTQYSIPFVEQPKAHFDVVSVDVPALASGDGADQIIVTIRNTGAASAQLATFSMQPSYVFEPSTQGSFTTTANVGVGTLSPGASANVTVVIQVNSNLQPGSYPLVFHATWSQLGSSQPFGQDLVMMLPVKASVFQIADSVLFSVPFLVVVVLVIVGLLVLRSSRRARRRPKPKEASA